MDGEGVPQGASGSLNTSFLIVAAVGLAGAVAVLWSAGLSYQSGAFAAVLVLAGLAAGYWLRKTGAQELQVISESAERAVRTASSSREEYIQELERLIIELFPILSRHIESSRQLAETNINSLTERFSRLSGELQRVVDTSRSQGAVEGGMTGLFSDSQASLHKMIESLDVMLKRESSMVEQVQSLSGAAAALDGMAQGVRTVAEQINVLALNAAIEAARAGEHGRGFAVVADEVRRLAASSAETGEHISEKIQDINQTMSQTMELVESSKEFDDQLVESSEATIAEVLSSLKSVVEQMDQNTGMLRSSSESINAEINEVLVELQFQDRMSQVLDHVKSSLSRVESSLKNIQSNADGDRHQNMLQVDELLQQMLKEYSTHEEVNQHHGQSGSKQEATSSELTFF